MSHKKFGPDRFSRFDVYWILTNRQTDRQAKFIYRWNGVRLRVDIGMNLSRGEGASILSFLLLSGNSSRWELSIYYDMFATSRDHKHPPFRQSRSHLIECSQAGLAVSMTS